MSKFSLIAHISPQVEERLMRRLSLAILSWTGCLKGVSSDSSIDTSMDTTPASSQPQHNLGGTPELMVSRYANPHPCQE